MSPTDPTVEITITADPSAFTAEVRAVVLGLRRTAILAAFPHLRPVVEATEDRFAAAVQAGRDPYGVPFVDGYAAYRTALCEDSLWDGSGTVTEYDVNGMPEGYASWSEYLSVCAPAVAPSGSQTGGRKPQLGDVFAVNGHSADGVYLPSVLVVAHDVVRMSDGTYRVETCRPGTTDTRSMHFFVDRTGAVVDAPAPCAGCQGMTFSVDGVTFDAVTGEHHSH